MSQQAINKKQQEVIEIVEKLNNSVATVIVEYAGLTVEELKELRKQLRAEGVELKVIKNNISSRAYKEVNLEQMGDYLKGPCAVAFSYEDVTAAARVLNDFSKEHEVLKLKAGTMEGSFADEAQIRELATLPSRDGLLSMLLSVLQAPMRGLAQTLSQVAEQQPAAESAVEEPVKEEPASEKAPASEEETQEEVVEETKPEASSDEEAVGEE